MFAIEVKLKNLSNKNWARNEGERKKKTKPFVNVSAVFLNKYYYISVF